ncbi:hypothetical protein [Pontibacter actiniarum]|uniref:hypothetical protein n=1 Tax=Pontibacter actiniarum TaxID=323450 RepID=UPI0004726647|nr:hypothetical protein [Pontibacter actiniarum]
MKNIFLIILALSLLTGCKLEPVEPNIETTVSGKVYDSWNKLPITDFKLRVAEYMKVRAGEGFTYNFIQFLDSTYTDADGNYAMAFRTSGKGNHYRVEYDRQRNFAYPYEGYTEIKAGEDNQLDYDFQRAVTLRARVIVHDNPAPPLAVGTARQKWYNEKIYGVNNDTVTYMQVIRNSTNEIVFSIHEQPSYRFHSEYIEVGDVALSDTVEHVFEIYPAEFK